MLGKCSLCENYRELQNSHAIGDSVFRRIFKQNSGKAIEISSGDKPLRYTSDSWAVPQLCNECEQFLNEHYEQYSLKALRGSSCKVLKSSYGVTFDDVNQHILILYFISIMWRTSKSSHSAYRNINIPGRSLNNYVREALKQKIPVSNQLFTVRMRKLFDPTAGGFTNKSLKSIVSAPFFRESVSTKKKTNVSYCMIFEGFFIEIFLEGLPIKDRNCHGVLKRTKKQLFVPNVNIFEIKEIVSLLVDALDKHEKGNSNVKFSSDLQV